MITDLKWLNPKILHNKAYIGVVSIENKSHGIYVKLEKSRYGLSWRTKVQVEPTDSSSLEHLPILTMGVSLGPTLELPFGMSRLTAEYLKEFIKTNLKEYQGLAFIEIKNLNDRYERFNRKGSIMKITLASLSEELDRIAQELEGGDKVALSPLQEEYQDYFNELMEKHDLKSISGVDQEKIRAFFNDVSKGWTKGEGAKD